MKFKNVGVIILTYNSEKYILKTIKSILNNQIASKNCVVVDNSSKDKTTEYVNKNYPSIKLILNKNNSGYAAGNNIGIKYFLKKRNISYILILNPDTLVSHNLIKELIDVFNNKKNAGITAPTITYMRRKTKIWYSGGYLNRLFCFTKHTDMNKFITPNAFHAKLTDFTTGACMLVKKSVFKKCGLLPEEYFMYFEDVDFCQRIHKFGFKTYVYTKPLVFHDVSASTGLKGTNLLTPFRAYYYARNPFIYIKKEVKGLFKITNYLGQFFIRLPYYTLHMLVSGNLKSIPAYMQGLIDGLGYKTNKQ